MSLLALQREMRAWLTREDPGAVERLGAKARPGLRVYQANYRTQLVACLEASYAKTLAWIGRDAFFGAAAMHIDAVPPNSWTLDAYARGFPETLAGLFQDDPEIAELAAIELALEEAFVGADMDALEVADMADVDWDRAAIRLTPTLQVVNTRTNAVAIWSSLAADEAPPPVCHLDAPEGALVWRQNHRSMVRALDQFEMQAVIGTQSGVPFALLCAQAVETFGHDAPAIVGRWLGRWMADSLIIEVVEQE